METSYVTPEDWEEQLIHFSMGAMDPQDAARFESALEQCRSRAQLAASYDRVVGVLGMAAQPAEPPAGHKVRLMARVAETAQLSSAATIERPELTLGPTQTAEEGARPTANAREASRAWFWTGAAAAVLMLGLVTWLVSSLGTIRTQSETIAGYEQHIETLRSEFNIPEGFRPFVLAPTDEYTGVSAVVFYNPDSNDAWLVADGLQPLPDDLIYELWLIRPQGQGPSEVGGVFPATPEGTAVHRAEAQAPIGDYAGFAVSIERKPGVQEREGPVVVVGLQQGQ